ncbi:MAG TPA: TlpA disulfide reductase family protein [Pyrinomonadaceae bacterium]|nr:TlpA family protein disulfide reductase [Acidobacteriota bacterium]HXG83138.1 TlpA disulfide reductase family protein [Pyrinomonadaceae bacterium]
MSKSNYILVTILMTVAIIGGLTACGNAVKPETAPSLTVAPNEQAAPAREAKVGSLAPEFELAKLDGAKISSADFAGKPAVLVFWTAWCPSCKEEAPHINRLAAEYQSKGVRVLGINIGEGAARVGEGIKDFGIEYDVVRDADAQVAKTYKVVGTPTVVFLDKKGVVRFFGNELPKDYAARLDTLNAGS